MSFAVAAEVDGGAFCLPGPFCGTLLGSKVLWQFHQASSRRAGRADMVGNDRSSGVSSLCWGYRPVGRFIDGKSLDGLYWNNISCPPTSVKPSPALSTLAASVSIWLRSTALPAGRR